MRFMFSIVLALALISSSHAQHTPIALIPQPVELQQLPGSFALTKAATVSYNKPEGKAVADMLVQKLSAVQGREPTRAGAWRGR